MKVLEVQHTSSGRWFRMLYVIGKQYICIMQRRLYERTYTCSLCCDNKHTCACTQYIGVKQRQGLVFGLLSLCQTCKYIHVLTRSWLLLVIIVNNFAFIIWSLNLAIKEFIWIQKRKMIFCVKISKIRIHLSPQSWAPSLVSPSSISMLAPEKWPSFRWTSPGQRPTCGPA